MAGSSARQQGAECAPSSTWNSPYRVKRHALPRGKVSLQIFADWQEASAAEMSHDSASEAARLVAAKEERDLQVFRSPLSEPGTPAPPRPAPLHMHLLPTGRPSHHYVHSTSAVSHHALIHWRSTPHSC